MGTEDAETSYFLTALRSEVCQILSSSVQATLAGYFPGSAWKANQVEYLFPLGNDEV